MSVLLERLRHALSPQFTVERELAGGGMGIVFLGHDVTLDRPVAIKVLRPEQATAVGVERFLREARVLARLRHPNIVPVFQGGDADGLLYHILEYQAGETLAQRLTRGPLAPDELESLADGLLSALATAHAAAVVHRDIKPSNVFLVDGRAVVGDFGIAHTDTGGESLTDAGALVGTRAYMAPEQWRGGDSTPRTDLYSAALVLAESATGRPAAELAQGGRGSLPGLPARWVGPLRRALAEDPGARWADAAGFRAALRGAPTRRQLLVRVSVGLVLAVLAVWLGRVIVGPPPGPGAHQFIVALHPLDAPAGGDDRAVALALHERLLQGLTGLPDIVVMPARNAARASLRVAGGVRSRGEHVEVTLDVARPGSGPSRTLTARLRVELPPEEVDSLVVEILLEIWAGDHPGEVLPRQALPQSRTGLGLFLRAEQRYAAGQWTSARMSYQNVEEIDPTCILCTYRIRDVQRWLNQENDSLLLRKLVSQVHRFPEPYRAVIEASALPPGQRLDALLAQRAALRDFFDFRYLLGDELFHRGPLYGHPRARAIEELEHARRLRPDFSGVAEHLVWAHVAEGDSARADALLDTLTLQHPAQDPFANELRAMHQLGFEWRFHPEDGAEDFTLQLLDRPLISVSTFLPAGPRMLPAFGAPGGAVGFGRLLESRAVRADLQRAGLVARTLGGVALGSPDSAVHTARTLARVSPDPEWQMLELSLLAWLTVVGEPFETDRLTDRLVDFRDRLNVSGLLDWRVDWWLAMLTGEELEDGGPAAVGPLVTLARANARARRGDEAEALRLTAPVSHEAYLLADPFAGATARLLRAQWMVQAGRTHDAMAELLWHEHSHVAKIPTEELQAAEVDWAAATFGIWRRAHLLAAVDAGTEELCEHWREVIRRWSGGMPAFAVRADSARRALSAAPQCEAGR
ncbi:MAG TPA: serine/threonine-protein kinase [Gemmatimonadales bacterium]|nr:serine/threonine-protein kinase [Gemmatimonadales bacterium]